MEAANCMSQLSCYLPNGPAVTSAGATAPAARRSAGRRSTGGLHRPSNRKEAASPAGPQSRLLTQQRRLRDDPRGVATLAAFKRRKDALAEAAEERRAAGGRFAPHQPRKPLVSSRQLASVQPRSTTKPRIKCCRRLLRSAENQAGVSHQPLKHLMSHWRCSPRKLRKISLGL